MTAVLSMLSEAWPFLLAAASVVFGWARHKQAQTAEAMAKKRQAEAEAHVAKAEAMEAKANQDAARAGADNAKVRRDEDSAAGAEPDANRVLHDEWGK